MRAVLATTVALSVVACPGGACRQAEAAEAPAKLSPPEGQAVLFKLKARGVQIYECKAGKGGRLEWTLKGPDADLFDDEGRRAGKHYAGPTGPTWEAKDGSTVVASPIEKVPARRAEDVPWLLLKAASHTGRGAFRKVNYIQRVDTRGGMAPGARPGADQEGKEGRVRYTATYIFHGKSPG